MIVPLAIATVLLGQLHLVARSWWGALAPDPLVVLVTLAALAMPRRRLLLVAALVGWVRAVLLVEPAGGQVLCVWAAVMVVGALRGGLLAQGRSGVLLAGGLVAVCWWSAAQVLGSLGDVPVSAGRELLLGAPLAVPFAGLAARRAA